MNLAEEMKKHCNIDDATGGELPTNDIDIDVAIEIAKAYAEEMCKKQNTICAYQYYFNIEYDMNRGNIKELIINSPLATEGKDDYRSREC